MRVGRTQNKTLNEIFNLNEAEQCEAGPIGLADEVIDWNFKFYAKKTKKMKLRLVWTRTPFFVLK